MKVLLLVVVLAQAGNPAWEPYGQEKKRPVVPEVGAYGAVLLTMAVGVRWFWLRQRRRT